MTRVATITTKAGREARIDFADDFEAVKDACEPATTASRCHYSGISTKGRAIGLIKRHLGTDEAFGWDDGQQFIVYENRMGTFDVFTP